MKKITLSPSRLHLFKECKRCFWLNINKGVRRPSGPFPSLPSGMDKVLKVYFDKYRENNCLPPDIEGKLKGHLFNDMEKLEVWRANRRGLRFVDKKTGITLMGALDDLFVTDDGLFIPLDFKTRGYPLKEDTAGHYKHQMDIYCFLLEKNGMKAGDWACLVFYHPREVGGHGKFEFNIDVVKLKASKEDGERLFREAIKVLQGEEPEADEGCKWCEWEKS